MVEETSKKVDDLQRRLTNFEKNYGIGVGVVGILAVVFGLSGARGLGTISKAKQEIVVMQNDLDKVEEKYKRCL